MFTWHAHLIAPDDDLAGAPLLRRQLALETGHGAVASAVLRVTAHGVVEPFLDGERVGDDVLSPGWSSYEWRLRVRAHDVAELLPAEPGAPFVLGLALGNGWWRGRLGWTGARALYGDELAGLAQLDVVFADGHHQVLGTDATWSAGPSATTANDLYDGQSIDARRHDPSWARVGASADGWVGVHVVERDRATLVEATSPPVRRTRVITPVRVWTSPSGAVLVDAGENVVGWVRFRVRGEAGAQVVVRHAEVLEDGELGVRPLRSALATDRYVLSGGLDALEPTMTFHGFRYAEVTGWPGPLRADDLEVVVVRSDLEPTGAFACSDEDLNTLHANVARGWRGNTLDVPTDCPQRDERLGWTGDLAVFAPTAVFLEDAAAFLDGWLADLDAEQRAADGLVPFVVPDALKFLDHPAEFPDPESTAVWSDAAAWVPWALWRAHGDAAALARHYPAMRAHAERVAGLLSPTGLWDAGFQFGDWLDPTAPPDAPFRAQADTGVVATACWVRTATTVADAASALGREDDAARFGALAACSRAAFVEHWVDEQDGRLVVLSDCVTVYALAIAFGVLEGEQRQRAGDRLAELVVERGHRISTGFAGTPYVTGALADTGHLDDAYALLLQRECPSWLYPVTMGATTVWERWDSMLPDGSINPGEMTSFNHYALGAVAAWMHESVAGLAPAEPGYARILFAPRPGGGLTWARASLQTPRGLAAVAWEVDDAGLLVLDATVPDGARGVVRLAGEPDREVGPGRHRVVGAHPVGPGGGAGAGW